MKTAEQSRLLHKWHRRIGIVTAVFVLVLALTGLMLNHTEKLELDRSYVQNSLLLGLYNIHPERDPAGVPVEEHWISQVGHRLYLDDNEIAENVTRLIGAAKKNGEFVIAFDNQLLIADYQGRVIENLSGAQGVPAGMRAIGRSREGEIVIRASHGDYLVDLGTVDWHEEELIEAEWSGLQGLPDEIETVLLNKYRGKGLSLERVLLDLHSGRLLGGWGVYVMDAAAILFLILAVSGVWMWLIIKDR